MLNALRHQRFGTAGVSSEAIRISRAQRLTASEVWHSPGQPVHYILVPVLNALRHQRFGTTMASPWKGTVRGAQRLTASEVWHNSNHDSVSIKSVCAQRLTASEVWHPAMLEEPSNLLFLSEVLNALRHQRFGTCSRSKAIITKIVLNALRHQRFGTWGWDR